MGREKHSSENFEHPNDADLWRGQRLRFRRCRQPLAVRQQVAVVLQQTAVETLLTVEDNLRIYAYLHGIGTSAANRRIDAVLDDSTCAKMPAKRRRILSVGTKRRVQVAKIFMSMHR